MPENHLSCLRYNCLLLAEAEQINRLILDCLCILNVEGLTVFSSRLTKATRIEITFKVLIVNSNLSECSLSHIDQIVKFLRTILIHIS